MGIVADEELITLITNKLKSAHNHTTSALNYKQITKKKIKIKRFII